MLRRSWRSWPPGTILASAALERGDLMTQDEDLGVLGAVEPGEQGETAEYPEHHKGRPVVVARVPKVPDRAALAQPYARLDLPRPSRRHQVNGRDSILGTHTLSSHANPASTVIAPAAELLTP